MIIFLNLSLFSLLKLLAAQYIQYNMKRQSNNYIWNTLDKIYKKYRIPIRRKSRRRRRR
jgi:hypothetical protein